MAVARTGTVEGRNSVAVDKREILDAARRFGVTPRVIEKDYVLGRLLAGVFSNGELAKSWVFKGGTCLKKCYPETYRFSEDLDLLLPLSVCEIRSRALSTAFARRSRPCSPLRTPIS